MIFVSVGSSAYAFDRLLIAVAPLSQVDELLVQRGASRVSVADAQVVDYLDTGFFDASIREARVIIGHAGVGVAGAAVAARKPLIVVPRLAAHDEAVDDHQVLFGNALSVRRLAMCVHDPRSIPAVLRELAYGPPPPPRKNRLLTDELRAAIDVALSGG
jgi:UDP-N-acetylglucosamine transferase subunit ALG13